MMGHTHYVAASVMENLEGVLTSLKFNINLV